MKRRMIWIAPLAILAMVLFVHARGYVVTHLWNWCCPGFVVAWRQITFWQGLGTAGHCAEYYFGGFRFAWPGRSNFSAAHARALRAHDAGRSENGFAKGTNARAGDLGRPRVRVRVRVNEGPKISRSANAEMLRSRNGVEAWAPALLFLQARRHPR